MNNQIIGIKSADQTLEDDRVEYGIILMVGNNEVESFWYSDPDSRDRAKANIAKNPLPWFETHVERIEEVKFAVPVQPKGEKTERKHLFLDKQSLVIVELDPETDLDEMGLSVCKDCTENNPDGDFIYHGPIIINKAESELAKDAMIALADYCNRVTKDIYQQSLVFVRETMQEVNSGLREAINGPDRIPTVEALTLQSDGCGYPMLPEEVEDWVKELRDANDYPDILRNNEKISQQLTLEEMIAFCLFLESKEPGAGKYVFAGKRTDRP